MTVIQNKIGKNSVQVVQKIKNWKKNHLEK